MENKNQQNYGNINHNLDDEDISQTIIHGTRGIWPRWSRSNATDI